MRTATRVVRFMVILGALGACACASPTKPALELGEDCRLRSLPWDDQAAPPGDLVFGGLFGGGPARPRDTEYNARSDSDYPGRRGDTPSRGVGFGIDLGTLLGQRGPATDLVPEWLAEGPGFDARYSNSCMPIRCLVQGGWPMVVDYSPDGQSITTIELHVQGQSKPVVFELVNNPGRRLMMFKLPASIGDSSRPAVMLVRSMRNKPGERGPGHARIHGLGAGPRAVGSVAIQQVDFRPPVIQRSALQQARYSFLSKSDFNHFAVGVLRIDGADGQIKVGLAREFGFAGGISRGTLFGRAPERLWDGTDAGNKASIGNHIIQVRAWMSSRNEADWVTAWSEQTVLVTP